MGRIGYKRYVTDSEKEYIETLIYNDQDMSHIFETKEFVLSPKNRNKLLLPDEQYEHIPEHPQYIVTDKGRLINIKTFKPSKPKVTRVNIHLSTGRYRNTVEKLFEEMGWEYDIEDIKNNYDKYKWPYSRV